MQDEKNPFLSESSAIDEQAFNYLDASTEQLKKHLNTTLTGKAMRTYEHLMMNSKDEKIRKECADKVMEHSSTSAKNNLQSSGQTPIQVNMQFNDYISKAASSLIDVAKAAHKEIKE